MYYEEKEIHGVWMWRNTPDGKWHVRKKDLPTVIGNIILNS